MDAARFDPKSQDLVVKVFPEEMQQGDPDVFISKTNKKPNRVSNSEWACSTFGKDTCTINGNEFRSGDIFYIGVRCGSTYDGTCTFSIQPTLTGEIPLEDGIAQELDFATYEAKVFKFHIPAKNRDDSLRVTSLVITAAPLLPMDEQMTLYASTKPSVNPKQGQKRGTSGWRKGQTLRLSSEDQTADGEWCYDCFVTILLDVTTAGKYQIMAKTNVGVTQLQEGVKVDDVSFFGERQCYTYFVKESKADVIVRVAQYSGLISYTFNPSSIPERFEDGKYRQAEFGSSALTITPKQRAANTGLYYLCVFSHMTSTYSLLVMETPVNQTFRYIEDGWDEGGEIVGSQQQVYLYKVPPLDFKGEDISVEFLLTVLSGETPKLWVQFCKDSQTPRKCGEVKDTLGFLQAKAAGKGLSLIIDHDEQQCQNKYNGECYYTLIIQGQSRTDGDLTKFSLTAVHSQQNYYVLQESTQISDYVNLGTYRYYSFTLPPYSLNKTNSKEPKPRNITITLNSLHGDADLFASRVHRYPNRMDFEKNSVRTGDMFDQVFFDDKNGTQDLSGTYYIAVYSFQYSTYSLQVTVDRASGGKGAIDLKQLFKSTLSLIEGMPVKGILHQNDEEGVYKMEIKQIAGFEKPIKIQISPINGVFKIYVKVGSPPTIMDYDFKTFDTSLIIKPSDPLFKPQATYYILIIPKLTVFERLKTHTFHYLLSYFTEDNYLYLKGQLPMDMLQKPNATAYNYFRHFIATYNKDISIAMTVFAGSPTLYASFDPREKWPNRTSGQTFSSKNQAGGTKNKALFFPQQLMHVQNQACRSPMVESTEPCVLYTSVVCEGTDECRYALKVNYELSGPQPLVLGTPQHSVVKDGTFNYYYLVVKESQVSHQGAQIVGVLSSLKGNADLYLSMIDSPSKYTSPEDWEVPDVKEYLYKSTQIAGRQDIIKIDPGKDDQLKQCFAKFNMKYGVERECGLVFGVYSPLTQQGKDASKNSTNMVEADKLSSRYNFVVYMDIMTLMSQVPVEGSVEQGEFQYYLFDSTCEDCTLLVSLSTSGSGDPDLYINFGDERLPSRDTSDMVSSTLKSEVITINLQHAFFKKNNLKSMRGPYILGVYGQKRSNYTLVISQEKYPVGLLLDNTATKASQEPFEVIYYAWYNLHGEEGKEKDFRVSLNVKNGAADVYMTTFVDEESNSNNMGNNQNLISRLPKSKRDAQWILENIDSKSNFNQRELVVVNQERKYCSQCFYLIGVLTSELRTDYSIQLDVMDQANFNNSHILKLGESYHASLNASANDRKRVYRFMIDDSSSPVQIVQTTANGNIITRVSFSENGEQEIANILNTGTYTLQPTNENFQTERMYYLLVEEQEGSNIAQHTIMIMQDRTIVRLSDGVPQKLDFVSSKDVSKMLMFAIPDGSYTFSIQIKTKTEGFYPKLYVKYYEDIETSLRSMEFPPGGEPGYFICKTWDYKLGILSYQERFDNIKGGKAGLALNLLEASSIRDQIQKGEVIITVSASPVVKMIMGNTYIGSLEHSTSFKIFQIEDSLLSREGFLVMDFTPCIGETEFLFLENPKNPSKQLILKDSVTKNKHGRISQFIKLPLKALYIQVRQMQFASNSVPDQSADFLIKVHHTFKMMTKTNDFYLPDDGRLKFTFNQENQGIDLKWGAISYINSQGQMISTVDKANYTVIATKDNRARLDSQCVMRKEVASKFVLANFNAESKTEFNLKTPVAGERYYVNIIAKVKAEGEEEAELIPYLPIEIYIPASHSIFSKFALLCFIVLALGFLGAALFYYRKSKDTSRQLHYELSDVRSQATISAPYHKQAIEMSSIVSRTEKYQNLSKIGGSGQEVNGSGVGEYQSISTTFSNGVEDSESMR